MIRSAMAVGLALGFLSLAPAAWAQTPAGKPDGLALGLRTGYSIPMGKIGSANNTSTSGNELPDLISGMVPIWLDVGYRINPSLYVGAFFQYGFAFVNKDKNPVCDQISCSAHDMAFGANLHYHVLPAASFDPWIGAGIGYEILTTSVSGTATILGQQVNFDGTTNMKGLQFITLQAGGDFKATPDFAVGPFVNFALGQYSTYSSSAAGFEVSGDLTDTGVHEWLTLGVRGQFNL